MDIIIGKTKELEMSLKQILDNKKKIDHAKQELYKRLQDLYPDDLSHCDLEDCELQIDLSRAILALEERIERLEAK